MFGVLLPLMIGGLTHQIGSKSRNVYRAVLFLPVLISPLVAALTWNFLLAPNGGAVNEITGVFGAAAVNWLFDSGDGEVRHRPHRRVGRSSESPSSSLPQAWRRSTRITTPPPPPTARPAGRPSDRSPCRS